VILLVVETDDWPPRAGDYVPRRILLRLGSLCHLTQVRSAGWTNNVAEVTVWPYNDDIVAAVRERLAPLAAIVRPQEQLPRRYSATAK